jgi:hypothetical protein
MSFNEEENWDEEKEEWDKIHEQEEIDFPDFPLIISLGYMTLDEYKKTIDEPFTDEKTIIVKDGRANEHSHYWKDCPKNDLAYFINYTIVNMVDDKPITLRQIFNEISKDPHYYTDLIREQDHIFLEEIIWDTDIQISFKFGS